VVVVGFSDNSFSDKFIFVTNFIFLVMIFYFLVTVMILSMSNKLSVIKSKKMCMN